MLGGLEKIDASRLLSAGTLPKTLNHTQLQNEDNDLGSSRNLLAC